MLKCLSVQQPWAWGIIHGPKRIENRSRKTNYRGPVLIHAGKSRKRLGDEGNAFPTMPAYDDLPFGAIIGVVDLVDCVPVADVADEPFAEGPWCWILANPCAFDVPIPYCGALGLFGVPESVIACPTFAERMRFELRDRESVPQL